MMRDDILNGLKCCLYVKREHFAEQPKPLSCGHIACTKCLLAQNGQIICGLCGELNTLDISRQPVVKIVQALIDTNIKELSKTLYTKFKFTENELKDEIENVNEKIDNQFGVVENRIEVRIDTLKSKLDNIDQRLKQQLNSSRDKIQSRVLESVNVLQAENASEKLRDEIERGNLSVEKFNLFNAKYIDLDEKLKEIRKLDIDVKFNENLLFDSQLNDDSVGSLFYNYENLGNSGTNIAITTSIAATTVNTSTTTSANNTNSNNNKTKKLAAPQTTAPATTFTALNTSPDDFVHLSSSGQETTTLLNKIKEATVEYLKLDYQPRVILELKNGTILVGFDAKHLALYDSNFNPIQIIDKINNDPIKPWGFASSSNGDIYISNHLNYCLYKLDSQLNYICSLKDPNGEFYGDICIHENYLYACIRTSNKVDVLTLDLERKKTHTVELIPYQIRICGSVACVLHPHNLTYFYKLQTFDLIAKYDVIGPILPYENHFYVYGINGCFNVFDINCQLLDKYETNYGKTKYVNDGMAIIQKKLVLCLNDKKLALICI